MTILQTRRLTLRELKPGDASALNEVQSDPETMRFYPEPFDLEKSRQWIEWCMNSYSAHGYGSWAVIHRQEDRLIGSVGITMQLIDGESLPEIGYQIHPDYLRQGYALEASSACRDYALNLLGFEFVVSWMPPDHIASRGVAERMGMKLWKEATSPKTGKTHVVYRIDRPGLQLDWEREATGAGAG